MVTTNAMFTFLYKVWVLSRWLSATCCRLYQVCLCVSATSGCQEEHCSIPTCALPVPQSCDRVDSSKFRDMPINTFRLLRRRSKKPTLATIKTSGNQTTFAMLLQGVYEIIHIVSHLRTCNWLALQSRFLGSKKRERKACVVGPNQRRGVLHHLPPSQRVRLSGLPRDNRISC